ncbi:hypothetical protein [Ramlibacter tataouinensis]|uniref:Uncharacterized protein n=1 Tax=Ramlibacter tataouinensis (strain ATCC BAA-407 / DSM 14655 / LMG 21543 / TTB310) TaxID=365046 RepID=F5Y0R3_RAMTT|nr:hypothetical protein [Ramlibacter tataouinensis]AEG94657.1 Hypothetical protein Rta_35440 [Ramlibacter tataouinensis TTB310]
MCPTDTTPDPRDMLRAPDEPEFLQPAPQAQAGRQARDADEAQAPDEAALDERPPLPAQPVLTAVDIEDEEADPVGDDSPGLAERFQSDATLQRG